MFIARKSANVCWGLGVGACLTQSMEETLADIFRNNMPCVDESMATEFAGNMQAYHEQFKVFRDESINYEFFPEYQTTQQYILQVPADSYWVYSPHFRKTTMLAIEHLFKTKITKMSFNAWGQCIVYIDEHLNRWIMAIDEPPARGEGFRKISMLFPRNKTQICTCITTRSTPLKTLIDPVSNPSLVAWDVNSSEFCLE